MTPLRFTWTVKELARLSDRDFLVRLCTERQLGLNPFAPLARRLQETKTRLEKENAK